MAFAWRQDRHDSGIIYRARPTRFFRCFSSLTVPRVNREFERTLFLGLYPGCSLGHCALDVEDPDERICSKDVLIS
ncbi:hypothetical protein DPEC_G00364600 [Dallia pectoralis]|nr:hypothetical protein DPEC_G00364600 [Dallia pectoralis]